MDTQGGQRRVTIGTVGRAHGVKGEVRVFPEDPRSQTLRHAPEVILSHRALPTPTAYAVLSARLADKFWVVRLKGVDTRDAAEALTGATCAVARDHLPPLAADEFYLSDVLGFDVLHATDQRPLGKALQVFHNGAHEVLVYGGGGEQAMVPFLKPFVDQVDMERRALLIQPLVWDE